ncbi:MAG: carbohydrate ABC transporter permease [Clostridia bacterium]|nr:carbohydrate ABC transporter permease [Clostridia bacterium]
MKIKVSLAQRIFDFFNVIFMCVLAIVMIYPVWHVVMASLSDNNMLIGYTGMLFKPLGFSINAYKLMIRDSMIATGYLNTIFIVVIGVSLNLLFTSIAAYFLSRKNVYWQKFVMFFIVVTMFFSGGTIPFYLFVTQTLKLNNSLWALILPVLINTYNMIIMRTSFMAIPDSLEEAARIDGASHWTVLFKIVLPLSKAIIAVMCLYYAVGHWNSWFNASLFIKDREKYPLQLLLREILIINDTNAMTQGSGDAAEKMSIAETVKYAVVVTGTLPILCLYPFLQKYFVKGVMIGSVKG